MRILLVANYLPPYEGGIQVVVDELARGYARRGHNVTVTGFDPAAAKRNEVPYEVAPMPAWNPLERLSVPIPLFEPITLWRRSRTLVSQADAVHVHGVLYPNVLVAVRFAHQMGRPLVVTEHVGVVPTGSPALDRAQRRGFGAAMRFTGRRARGVAVLNDRVTDEVDDALAPAPARDRPVVVRIDNGVDRRRFSPVSSQERDALRKAWGFSRPTALFVGRRSRKKGLDLVLDAAARSPSFDVAICGKDTKAVEATSDNVRIIGLVDREVLADLYRAADVLLLPSEGEGFPLVVQEALAAGLPAVVTGNTLPADADSAPGVTVADRTPDGLVAAVEGVLAGDRERAGTAARATATERFDWDRTVDHYLSLLTTDDGARDDRAGDRGRDRGVVR